MALEEPTENDNVYDVNGVKFFVDKELENYTKGFSIDYKLTIFGKRFFVNSLSRFGSSCR